jgi:hypothetical protein
MTTATQARNRCHYAERLAAALGDGSRWEYRGECAELPRATGRHAVDALAAGDNRTADDHAPRGTDARRAADRYLMDLDAAGCPIGPARPAPARCVPMFAD